MDDLLEFAIDAHGGLKRWNEFQRLEAEVSIDGEIWRIKQVAGLLKNKLIEMETHRQRLSIRPFPGQG